MIEEASEGIAREWRLVGPFTRFPFIFKFKFINHIFEKVYQVLSILVE